MRAIVTLMAIGSSAQRQLPPPLFMQPTNQSP